MRWAGILRPWPVYTVEVNEDELHAIQEALSAEARRCSALYEVDGRKQLRSRLMIDISAILERGKKS